MRRSQISLSRSEQASHHLVARQAYREEGVNSADRKRQNVGGLLREEKNKKVYVYQSKCGGRNEADVDAKRELKRTLRVCASGNQSTGPSGGACHPASGQLEVRIIIEEDVLLLRTPWGRLASIAWHGRRRVPAGVDAPLRYRGEVGPIRVRTRADATRGTAHIAGMLKWPGRRHVSLMGGWRRSMSGVR